MPLIRIQTSINKIDNQDEFLNKLSSEISKLTGKSEQYVMTVLETNIPMTFAGSSFPSCYVEIKSIGALNPPLMSEIICKLISNKTKIPSNRIYISFEDVAPNKWGFDGNTFG
tara:strand:+ start:560 stop:898 length:339 start_codon:yes stop_codon:yes gene_type:complete